MRFSNFFLRFMTVRRTRKEISIKMKTDKIELPDKRKMQEVKVMNIIFCKKDVARDRHLPMLQAFVKKNNYQTDIRVFGDAEDMLFKISDIEYSIDLLLLDVSFPNITGFEVVNRMKKNGFRGEAIFLTDIPDQWDRAFDVQAFHYVLESNCTKERFEDIVGRAILESEKKQQDTIVFTCAGERVIVPVRDISYFMVTDRWVTVHYGHNQSFEFFSRMGKIEQHLTGRGFVRIHRSCIVSVRYIAAVRYKQVILQDGTVLALARGKFATVKELFERYEGLGEVL